MDRVNSTDCLKMNQPFVTQRMSPLFPFLTIFPFRANNCKGVDDGVALLRPSAERAC
jgi:hypothetical protein